MNSEKETSPTATQVARSLVTNHFLKQVEEGVIPWHLTFKLAGIPTNHHSGHPYNGINVWLLNGLDYDRNIFLTYKQISNLGGNVKTGEKGHLASFWAAGTTLVCYKLYNIAQTDLPQPETIHICTRDMALQRCKEIAEAMPHRPSMLQDATGIFYDPKTDVVHLPIPEYDTFNELYYGRLFYALIQSTGAKHRLHREETAKINAFQPDPFSNESLIAEMGSSFLCSYCGIHPDHLVGDDFELEGWRKKLEADHSCIITAATLAQKAVNYILNISSEKSPQDETK